MKSSQNAMMFRKGFLATAIMTLTFSSGAWADDKSATNSGSAEIAATDLAESPDLAEDDQAGFEDDQAGGEDEWADFEGDPADFEGDPVNSEDDWAGAEDDWAGAEDDWEGAEGDWEGAEGDWEGAEGDWEESGDEWGEFEDYLAEFEDGQTYAWESIALFRAFSSGTKSAIPGGWETIDRRTDKVNSVARFAVLKQNKSSASSDSQIELIRVLYARQQVVSGLNYSVRLQVKYQGETRIARAKVWSRAGMKKPYKLLKWTWLPSVNKVKR